MNLNDSTEGRWLLPDLLGGDVANPQSLNRYAYALNNPTTLTDPSGLGPCPSINGMPTICITSNADGDGDGNTPPGLSGGIGECPFYGCVRNCSILTCGPTPNPYGGNGGGGGGPAPAPKPARPANGSVVPSNPCQYQGRALSPADYAAQGKSDSGHPFSIFLNTVTGFPRGHFFDPQPLASGTAPQKAAYGNYTFGVYMSAAGVSLSTALWGADAYAWYSRRDNPKQYVGLPMDPNYGSLPTANVTNIMNGYNSQANGTACSAQQPLPPSPAS